MSTRKPPALGEKGYERIANDLYETPTWVTKLLASHFSIQNGIWEPACGHGHMSKALESDSYDVYSTDIVDYGFGDGQCDFLSSSLPFPAFRSIVTNPPYDQCEKFIDHALALTKPTFGFVAMLLAHEFDAPFYHRKLLQHCPAYHAKLLLPKRIRWVGFEKKTSPRQVHAWYIWDWSRDLTKPPITLFGD